MKTIFTTILLALLAGKTFADPAYMIKQKAKEVAGQNNAQQRQPPQSPASRPAIAPSAAAPVQIKPTPEQQALTRVVADFNGIRADHSDKLSDDLMAMTRSVKPSAALVQKLAKDLATALAGKTLPDSQLKRLAQNVQVVLAGMAVSASQLDRIISDVPTILQNAGADATLAAAVGDDLRALNTEIKSNATK